MNDKKITDAKIVLALECCKNDGIICMECPYKKANGCMEKLSADALDLINRQKAEIERLQKHIQEGIDLAKQIPEMVAIAQAEAIKEFAERLKEDVSNHRLEMYMNGLKGTPRTREITYECVEEYIDNLVKEMVGDVG